MNVYFRHKPIAFKYANLCLCNSDIYMILGVYRSADSFALSRAACAKYV